MRNNDVGDAIRLLCELPSIQTILQYYQLEVTDLISLTPTERLSANIRQLFEDLARFEKGQALLGELFKNFPTLFKRVKLNVVPEEDTQAGKTAFWYLATTSGRTLLLELFKNFPALFQEVDLNVAPKEGSYVGVTAFWGLAGGSEGWALLGELFKNSPTLFQEVDLNVAPKKGKLVGMTAFWSLTRIPEGRALLLELFKIFPVLFKNVDLNAAPKEGPRAGITAFWCLVGGSAGRTLFLELFKVFPNSFKEINLNAAPEGGDDAGKTAFWCLAEIPEGRALLMQCPTCLIGVDFNRIINNKSVWELMTPADNGLKKALLLLGADTRLAADRDNQEALNGLKKELNSTLNTGIQHFYSQIDHRLPDEITLDIIFSHLTSQHPELCFIKPIFPKIVELRVGSLLDEPLQFIAHLAIRRWMLNSGILLEKPAPVVTDNSHLLQTTYFCRSITDQQRKVAEEVVLSCLRQEEQQDYFARGITRELRAAIIYHISILKEAVNRTTVTEAIQKAVSQWRQENSSHYFDRNSFGSGIRLGIFPGKYNEELDKNPTTREELREKRAIFLSSLFENKQQIESKQQKKRSATDAALGEGAQSSKKAKLNTEGQEGPSSP